MLAAPAIDHEAAMAAIARYYDLDFGAVTADLAFYQSLLPDGGPVSVLELGAGTGRVAIPLAGAGARVVALESSPAMLAAGRAAMEAAGVTVVEADFRRFGLEQRFDLVICAFSTFRHLLTPEDQRACLMAVRRHLTPGGRLVLDLQIATPDEMAPGAQPLVLEWVRRDARTGSVVTKLAAMEADPQSSRLLITYIYDARRSDGTVERTLAQFPLRQVTPGELRARLREAGLKVRSMAGDYTGGGRLEERMVVVAGVGGTG